MFRFHVQFKGLYVAKNDAWLSILMLYIILLGGWQSKSMWRVPESLRGNLHGLLGGHPPSQPGGDFGALVERWCILHLRECLCSPLPSSPSPVALDAGVQPPSRSRACGAGGS
jgi:hypothetical protein